VTEALDRLASYDDAPSVVNIGSGVGHSLREIVTMIEEAIRQPIASLPGEPRRADIPVSVLDVRLAATGIGFRAAVPVRDGLLRTLRHYGIGTPGAHE
jgi:UDP-glucose 4-epimerase